MTLAGAALESWIGSGLGLVTLLTLTAASAVATLVVRRSDLLTTVVAPPLVYIAVDPSSRGAFWTRCILSSLAVLIDAE